MRYAVNFLLICRMILLGGILASTPAATLILHHITDSESAFEQSRARLGNVPVAKASVARPASTQPSVVDSAVLFVSLDALPTASRLAENRASMADVEKQTRVGTGSHFAAIEQILSYFTINFLLAHYPWLFTSIGFIGMLAASLLFQFSVEQVRQRQSKFWVLMGVGVFPLVSAGLVVLVVTLASVWQAG